MPQKGSKKTTKHFDPEFRFLLNIDPLFEEWRALASEWMSIDKTRLAPAVRCAISAFLVTYVHGEQLDKRPCFLFDARTSLPNLHAVLELSNKTKQTALSMYDSISDFLDWVLHTKMAEFDAEGHRVPPLQHPFPRLRRKIAKRAIEKFDPEFRFLLDLDPDFEDWRRLASEWYSNSKDKGYAKSALISFLCTYLHGQQLDKRPPALLDVQASLPNLTAVLELDRMTQGVAKSINDRICDFLDWVLLTKMTELDAEGHSVIPGNLQHPFPRSRKRNINKTSDITLSHVVALDPKMEYWQKLASEWMTAQKGSESAKRQALDTFLVKYIIGCDQTRNPITYLQRTTPKPSFTEVLLTRNTERGKTNPTKKDIEYVNHVTTFLDWVLTEKLSVEDELSQWVVPHELHNPVVRLSKQGVSSPTETVQSSLSIRYIKELRKALAEGLNFCDWKWAQHAFADTKTVADWFIVDPRIINRDDPDCVWRERDTSSYERKTYGYPPRVTELWSPVRAVALYVKLELPLRTFQVRMLDSGEADTWRYVHEAQGSSFVLNDSPLATGTEIRPYQRGVFHRNANESGAGLFINTNKTADINKLESEKGYLIPWAHETVLYWLDKLRNWQERYNSITKPTAWRDLETKHFGRTPPHPDILESRGTSCFLFRDPAAVDGTRDKPLRSASLNRLWYLLLSSLEKRCLDRGDTLDDGTPIQFVAPDSLLTTHYPLHSLRVSLICYLVFDLQLPVAVVSKLIAGHHSIIMTLYYTKCGHAYMKEVLDAAERNMLATDESSHRRFLMDATMEQVSRRFASVSVDAVRAAIGQKSAAAFVFEDKGFCPVGGKMCDIGGNPLAERDTDRFYAPVPGYPNERNCVRCRFFLSGPAFLPGLQAHFNAISYETHERAERHNNLHEEVTLMENRRANCERNGSLFTESRELERLSQRYEAEAEAMSKLINDMQATHYLIARSLEITKEANKDGVQLVAVGEMSDLEVAFTETTSELHQIEVLCETAVIYPEIDARKPTMRRSQLLDCMLEFNRMPPIFFRLNHQQQLETGNAVMQLIQARTGSLKDALEFVEGQRRLRELGIVDETWDVIADKVAGTPAREIIDRVRDKHALPAYHGDSNAS